MPEVVDPDDPLLVFAANLRRLREEQGLTQQQVAIGAGMMADAREIRELESADRDPGVRVILRLSEGLGVPPARLFECFEQEDPPTA